MIDWNDQTLETLAFLCFSRSSITQWIRSYTTFFGAQGCRKASTRNLFPPYFSFSRTPASAVNVVKMNCVKRDSTAARGNTAVCANRGTVDARVNVSRSVYLCSVEMLTKRTPPFYNANPPAPELKRFISPKEKDWQDMFITLSDSVFRLIMITIDRLKRLVTIEEIIGALFGSCCISAILH